MPRTPPPGTTLADLYPNIATQWHPTLNGGLTPGDVTPGSNTKVWWLCETCGHKWQAAVNNRTGVNKTGCIACSRAAQHRRPRKPRIGRSLADIHPQLATQWHPTKNDDITPRDVTPGSKFKVWWLCGTCGHEWFRPVVKRTMNGSGCAKCVSRSHPGGAPGPQTPSAGQSLGDLHPQLATQWHPTKNEGLTPTDFKPGSKSRAWWIGPCGHEWEQVIQQRTAGRGCSVCAGKVVQVGVNDLASVAPDVALQWHPTSNGDVTPPEVFANSASAAWWRCPEGHEWRTRISNRVRLGTRCPFCAGQRPIEGVNDLATTDPNLAAQWAADLNGKTTTVQVMRGSNRKRWWRCKDGHTWAASPNSRTSRGTSGCPVCSNKIIVPGLNDLASTHPDIASQWHPTLNGDLAPVDVSAGSSRVVWWTCDDGHDWKVTVAGRGRSGCPFCSGRQAIPGLTDITTTHPDIVAALWAHDQNTSHPTQYSAGSEQVVWWRCDHGHEWQGAVNVHVRLGLGCPVCSGRRLAEGINDLASQAPHIAGEWHPALNGSLRPDQVRHGSHTAAWWLCPDGHDWKTEVRARTSDGVECHVCSGRVVLPGSNDLATTHPDVAEQWVSSEDGQTPTTVVAGSNRMATWQCHQGHRWVTSYIHRTHAGSGCPNCTMWGTSRQEIRLAHEINTITPLLWGPSTAVVQTPERTYRVDMLLEHHPVVIEFDGARWHSLPDSLGKDTRKTHSLETAGYTVIRIREPGLPPIGRHDITGRGDKTFDTTVLVLQSLAALGVIPTDQADEYEKRGTLVAADQAEEVIANLLAA